MKFGSGKILEISKTAAGSHKAVIQLSGISVPAPGQYLQVNQPADTSQAAGFSLFPGGLPYDDQAAGCFTTASPVPPQWAPGDSLLVRGPLGKGFNIPEEASRLALIAFSRQVDHLLPLAALMLDRGDEVAMFINSDPDSLPSHLPARIEINKLNHLSDGLKWAHFSACSVDLSEFSFAGNQLAQLSPLGCPCQILVYGQMPCAGLADCGICAVRMPTRGSRLVCRDGPVFVI